jgi:hypothetical protein
MATINQSAIAQSVASFNAFEGMMVKANEARETMGKTMCAILPLEITFDDYTATAKAWKLAYAGKTDGANDTAWSRAIGHMNGYLISIKAEIFTAPKSESKEAQAKAEKRAAHVAKVEAAAKSAKPADLQKRAMAGDKVAAEAIAFLGKKARENEQAKHVGLLKSVRAELKEASESQLKDIARILGIKP